MLFAGCGNNQQAEKNSVEFTIVTSFYPMYIATVNITKGIDGVTVTNMTKPQTGCLHDYQLTPEDMKKLEKANAFVVNGAGMEAFLDKAVKRQKNMIIIDASKNIELLKDASGEENPHVWVSVTNAIIQVKNIAIQLAEADPKHAAAYKKNAAEYVDKLETLKKEMHKKIDPLTHHDIVTFHEAFPYFAKEFNLNIVAVVEREPGSDPSPKDIEKTVELVKRFSVKALFAEPQYPKGAAQTIARESGGVVYSLDPVVTGEANEEAYNAYIKAMKKNADVLVEALR
ncbi:MAG: metal ABC transporter substrate-binding protein [Selenomonadaceae bacterium]